MRNTLLSALAALGCVALHAQNGPIDFEPGGIGANWQWTVFENAGNVLLEIVDNPDVSNTNPSSKVAKFTAMAQGNPWAGCESQHGSGTGSFAIQSSNAIIRITVWKSVISDVGIKLVRPDGWSLGEIKVSNTLVNQWEQLSFDFTSHIGLSPNYDQVVIFPDFRPRSANEVIYFDDVFGAEVIPFSADEFVKDGLKVWPNPGNGLVNIQSQLPIKEVVVLNALGQIQMKTQPFDLETTLDIQNLAEGIYTLTIKMDNQTVNHRYIKLD